MTRLSRDCQDAPNKTSEETHRITDRLDANRLLIPARLRENESGYAFLAVFSLLFILFGLTQNAPDAIFAGFWRIITSTNILITDYVALGGIGAAFVNAGFLMLLSVLLLLSHRTPFRGITVAGVFLMGSFGLFGKNIYNVWPILFGTWLYARFLRDPFREHIYTALFATSLSPIVTEFAFVLHLPEQTGAPLGVLVGVCVGLVAPPLAAHLKCVHRGFSLYNIGFTTGIIGTVFVSLLKSYGYQTGFNLIWSDGHDVLFGGFLCLLFAFFTLTGFFLSPHPVDGLRRIFRETGQSCKDFSELAGFGAALLNMGLNGFVATGYVLLVGGPLNGPTIGGILTIAGFGACGKHLRNAVPVLLGVVLGSMTKVWNINDPAVLLAALFGTSLAPISGHYGWAWGVVAGFLNSSVALSSGIMHGGMNLYNTGFSAGIVAAFLVPLLEALPKRIKRNMPQEKEARHPGAT